MMQGIVETKSSSAIEAFKQVRSHSIRICEPLTVEDYVPQPESFVSPPKWHLAHSTWFFEEFVLKKYVPGYQSYHPDFGFLFNSYYNAVGKRILRSHRGNITRPGVDEVYDYRHQIDQQISELLVINSSEELLDLVTLGIHHEQQHQELLLTDIKYILSRNPLLPVYSDHVSLVAQENREHGSVTIPEGVYEIGYKGNGFHYDNEKGRHKVFLHDFQISKRLVTNLDFIEFMTDGGYQRSELWLDEGWTWLHENDINHPLYWYDRDGIWHQYTLSGAQVVNHEDMLAHINHYEASAFAEWKGMRLPTEFEWEVASKQLKWGDRWEWTSSAYLPYPGFLQPTGAIGEYNAKFMINQMVLRGASAATSRDHSRPTYRNFFHPSARWQCTGIRLAPRQAINI